MIALASRFLAAVPAQPAGADELPPAISSDLIMLLMLGVGVFLTIVLIGFFAFVIRRESKRSGTNADAKENEHV